MNKYKTIKSKFDIDWATDVCHFDTHMQSFQHFIMLSFKW